MIALLTQDLKRVVLPLAATAVLATTLPPSALGQEAPPVADFADAPDNDPACEAGTILDPAKYPTEWGTTSAAPGRTAPYHVPAFSPDANYFLGSAPTYEPLPPGAFEPTCDWITGLLSPVPPPCDQDNAPLVLCLTPTCTTGVFSVPFGACDEAVVAAFGPPPVPPVGFWLLEAGRGPLASQPGYVNAAVDWDLDGTYGNAPGEWVLQDEPLTTAPGTSQIMMTSPFPVPTVYPCVNPLGWCISPFWTRFMLSDEQVTQTFDGSSFVWDGSGRLEGYKVGETEDWVVESDPRAARRGFPDCDVNDVPDKVDVVFGRLHDQDRDGHPDECPRVGDVDVTPAQWDYGKVPVGSSKLKAFVVRNTGSGPLRIQGTVLDGQDASAFKVVSGGGPGVIAPGKQRRILVRFRPGSLGPKAALLHILSDDPDESTKDVSLLGYGYQRPPR